MLISVTPVGVMCISSIKRSARTITHNKTEARLTGRAGMNFRQLLYASKKMKHPNSVNYEFA